MRKTLLVCGILGGLPGLAFANCPDLTLSDTAGIEAGAYPQQYELAAYEQAANCQMVFSENPDIGALNALIRGNDELPSVEERLPEEPLVVIPYESIGKYGGTLDMVSTANEAGTSDVLSVRHVNLVRYSDNLQTIVPNIAKSWQWNDDFTELTFTLRKGHKWSDGAPFTSADVKFWYDHLVMDPAIHPEPPEYALVSGRPAQIETPDPLTVVVKLPAPKPGLLIHIATSYAQAFQPKHFLGQFHPATNPDADKRAQELGFENGYAVIKAYYGNSDWADTPTPYLNAPGLVSVLPAAVMPTLESHIYVDETPRGRHLVANPYFHQVDPRGQQLPYISEHDEVYINDAAKLTSQLVNGDIDYKAQGLRLQSTPILMDNRESGGFSIQLRPTVSMPAISFNYTSMDPAKRALFNELRFRKAMSLALNRQELNEVAYFGQGRPAQISPFMPAPSFVDPEWARYQVEYDPEAAKALLDEIGFLDGDQDGFRELPGGVPLVLDLRYSTEGIAGTVVELIAEYWREIGIKSIVKEVSTNEYRLAQLANELDVSLWEYGAPMAIHLGENSYFRAPFGNAVGHQTGILWGKWLETGGLEGVEPPDYIQALATDIDAFQSAVPGSDESNRIGAALVDNFVGNLVMIGTVQTAEPIYISNKLHNVPEFRTWSYEYYRTYPYRGPQWWLSK